MAVVFSRGTKYRLFYEHEHRALMTVFVKLLQPRGGVMEFLL